MRNIRERLEREMKDLERELRYDLPKEIQRATALGDLRENAEYHAALERQSYVKARIGQLSQRISQLANVQLDKLPRERAAFGSIVKLLDLDTDDEVRYELVLPEDGDPSAGKISVSSPIGKALLGKEVGEEVHVVTPGGDRVFELAELVTLHERGEEDVDGGL